LVAVAGAIAAACAHVAIDVAGDYVLPRDAYDGIAHHSRAMLLALVGLAVLVVAVRAICDILDRRCGSTRSTLAAVRNAVGNPIGFTLAAAAVAVVTLVGMESFDCSLTGRVDDVGDLFGGSVALGASSAVAFGALFGWLTHRCVRLIAKYEAPIAAFIVAVFRLVRGTSAMRPASRRTRTPRTLAYALVLSRQGRKRGPPRPVFG
jgi:hypothetical protein